ncbi:MAG: glycerol-3-phosphate 1-O-acyltransferase PlsY [Gammaproteobacteria bacterium]|nr:glycerol-3-phosphate 1-O-acyltransferase PlsY [Gammaproteobacteria bacterium]
MLLNIIFIILAYIIGSISSAILVCKMNGLPDPRSQGSGNPGATNVLRIGGKGLAVTVLLLDTLKGIIPVIIAKLFGLSDLLIGCVALAAVIGHIYPLFFKFQGGKGVATAIGTFIAISWLLGLAFAITWLIVAAIFRYSSLAALVAIVLMPLYAIWLAGVGYIMPLLIIAILTIYRHRTNIKRLCNKTEPKLGKKT